MPVNTSPVQAGTRALIYNNPKSHASPTTVSGILESFAHFLYHLCSSSPDRLVLQVVMPFFLMLKAVYSPKSSVQEVEAGHKFAKF